MSKTRLFVLRSPSGAIGYAKLNATTGYQIVGVIRQENGRFPPLGVNVTDKATGKDVGLVAEDGFVYLSGIQENSILHLTRVIIPVKSRRQTKVTLAKAQ